MNRPSHRLCLNQIIKLMLAATLILTACSALNPVIRTAEITPRAPTQSVAAPVVSPSPVENGSTLLDVTYCSIRGTDLKMDLYYPREGSQPFPVVMYIHGGGWSEGDKAEGAGTVGAAELMDRGYALASINYRMAPGFRFPSMIEDAKCAVRSLRANAVQWGIDPDRIGVMGASAGGHLAALVGTADEKAGWDSGKGYTQPYLDQSSRVGAVVDLYGPADLPVLFAGTAQNLAQSVFGVKRAADPFLAQSSPVTYVSPDDAPFLILHGTVDNNVPLEQSQILDKALRAAGVESTLVVVDQAGHGFPRSGQAYTPGYADLAEQIALFFDAHLGK